MDYDFDILMIDVKNKVDVIYNFLFDVEKVVIVKGCCQDYVIWV